MSAAAESSESPSNQTGYNPEIEGGFTHFKSQLYPYETDYPPSVYQISHSENAGVTSDLFSRGQFDFVSVRAEFLEGDVDTDAYASLMVERYKSELEKAGGNIEGVSADKTGKIGGVRAKIVELLYSREYGTLYQLKGYIFTRNGMGWDVHYNNEALNFETHAPLFDKMVDSFRFTD